MLNLYLRKDKASLSSIFDRETKREKILEGLNREKELLGRKGVLFQAKHPELLRIKEEAGNMRKKVEDPIVKAEREFYETIEKIKKQREEEGK